MRKCHKNDFLGRKLTRSARYGNIQKFQIIKKKNLKWLNVEVQNNFKKFYKFKIIVILFFSSL